MAEDIKEGGQGHYMGLGPIRGFKVPNEPHEPLWALIMGNTPRPGWVCIKADILLIDTQRMFVKIFINSSSKRLFFSVVQPVHGRKPCSVSGHVSNPADLKCLKCQIFHFHIPPLAIIRLTKTFPSVIQITLIFYSTLTNSSWNPWRFFSNTPKLSLKSFQSLILFLHLCHKE